VELLGVEMIYDVSGTDDSEDLRKVLKLLLGPTSTSTILADRKSGEKVVEVGPSPSFKSVWSTNASDIAARAGLAGCTLDRRRLYRIRGDLEKFLPLAHDRMTEVVSEPSLKPFVPPEVAPAADASQTVSCTKESLDAISKAEGLGFDEQDLTYYADLYQNVLKREATREELFDLAQGNSEHSRHWFFGGNLKLDGKDVPHSLFSLVKRPIKEPSFNF
jgi:phosphoribosylformylglycinamidine synthase